MTQAAAAAAGAQTYPPGALYVVATPIGNLADLSLRAIHVLALVDAVACEDTRHSASLLRHLGLDKTLIALHQHNEHQATQAVLARLARGERVACVSDAGTPAISDPGAWLVAAAHAAAHPVVAVPGPSSAVAAVSVAGDVVASGFSFTGFLSNKAGEREQAIKALAACSGAQVLFEAPHRIEALTAALAHSCGPRHVTLCRELTKQFETVITLPAADLPAWLAGDANRARGEFVLVVHALVAPATDVDSALQHDAMLTTLLNELPLKQAVTLTAQLTGAARNALYARALVLKAAVSQ